MKPLRETIARVIAGDFFDKLPEKASYIQRKSISASIEWYDQQEVLETADEIIALLSSPESGAPPRDDEPVGYRWRWGNNDIWTHGREKPSGYPETGFTCEPLYTSPTPARDDEYVRVRTIEECAKAAEHFAAVNRTQPGSYSEGRAHAGDAIAAHIRALASSSIPSTDAQILTSGDYLTKHHEITEKWIGIARLKLSRDRIGDAREALDNCVSELRALSPSSQTRDANKREG